jgi:hypothetical protein
MKPVSSFVRKAVPVAVEAFSIRRTLRCFMRQALRAQSALLVRGSSRRIMSMRFRPANIRVINRRVDRLGRHSRCFPLAREKHSRAAPQNCNLTRSAISKPGALRSIRAAKRKSCHHASTRDSQPALRTTSFAVSGLSRSKRTARSASLRLIPCFIFSSAAISRKPFSSSSSSWLTCFFRSSARSPPAIFPSNDMVRLRRLQDSGDCRHLPSPFSCFAIEPRSSLVC